MASQFCIPALVDESNPNAPFKNTKDFQLHNRKRFPSGIDNVIVNSWVRCRSDIRVNDQSAITIEQDINTLSEELEERAFKESTVDEFFQWAVDAINDILNLYFPE